MKSFPLGCFLTALPLVGAVFSASTGFAAAPATPALSQPPVNSVGGALSTAVGTDLIDLITQADKLGEPVLWVGEQPPAAAESQLLWQLIQSLPAPDWRDGFEGFIAAFPNSPWTPSVRSHYAKLCREKGVYSIALREWKLAWEATRNDASGSATAVADFTLAYWSQLLASLGRADELKDIFNETKGRVLQRGLWQDTFQSSKEGYITMIDHPELAFRCGTFALFNVGRHLDSRNNRLHKLADLSSTTRGFTLAHLQEIADEHQISLVTVERPPLAEELIVPSVIHWKQDHYAAILAQSDGLYWVKDPTFGAPQWMTAAVINSEASGRFMAPAGRVPQNWRQLSKTEAAATHGKGQPNNIEDWKDEACDKSPGGAGSPGRAECPPCKGMAGWWITEPYINLFVADEPLGYTTSHGENIAFRWTRKQRETLPVNRYLLPTLSARATNMMWDNNWLSHIQYKDPYYDAHKFDGTLPPNYIVYTNWDAMVFMAGSGIRLYSTNAYPPAASDPAEARSKVRLQRIFSRPTGFPVGNYYAPPSTPTNGFRFLYPDGSQDVYSLEVISLDGSSYTRAEAFLTMKIDPFGNAIKACYTNYVSGGKQVVRLMHLIDYDGRTNTFSYNSSFPQLVSQIQDPYGRLAQFSYDPWERLYTITDAVNNVSSFTYNGLYGGTVNQVINAYGTTTFWYFEADPLQNGSDQGNLGGHDRMNRYVQANEPNGAKQLYMYRYDSGTRIPSSYPTSEVPTNSSFLIDNGTNTSSAANADLHFRNSFYWGRKQFPSLSTVDPGTFTTNDYKLARMRHWLDSANDAVPTVSDRISIERDFSPDGIIDGQKTFYSYEGKSAAHRVGYPNLGYESLLSFIGQVLPDGSSSYREIWYYYINASKALPQHTVSTYTATNGTIGRRDYYYLYAANDVDLIQIQGPDGLNDAFIGYNTNHQILSYTDAVGEVTSFSYNAATHQPLTRRLASGLNTTYNYYSLSGTNGHNAGFLSSITDNEIGRTVYFTWTNGLGYALTDERNLTTTNSWDGLQRLISTTYPDGTFISNRFDKLDMVASKDRLDHWTYAGFDALDNLFALTNALGRSSFFGWCSCGSLQNITNALQQVTTVTYDYQVRPVTVSLADGSSIGYGYDGPGRATNIFDGAGRSRTFWFNNQGLKTGASNILGKVFSVVYDIRDRPIQVTDADGVTVTQTFDLVNRLLSRSWPDGGSEGFLYSTNGLIAYTNQLAAVTWFTNDAAYRLVARRDANNHVVRFSYNAASDLLALTDGNGKATIWLLDSFGQVLAKTNGLNQLVFTNAFNADYQLIKHWTPEKGLTTLVYDEVHNLRQRQPAGEMTILYDFDALNHLTNMVDYVGTNRLTYTAAGQILTEDGPWASDTITYGYTQQQRTSLSLLQPSAPAWSLTYSYEAARRLQTLTSPAGAFTYGYTPGLASSRPIQNWLPNAASATNHYDVVARLDYTALLDSWGHVLDGYSYIHDRSGVRTNITRDFGLSISTVSVGSDPIGQITSWTGRESNGVLRLNEQLGYGYNPSDNLNSRTNGALVQTFTVDGANQLTNVSRTGAMTLTGATPAPASSVTVNGQTAQTYADFAFARTNNTLANGQNTFTIIAQAASGLKVTNNLSVNLPATATLQYDRNGNLTNDGIRSFSFDAANQLTNVTIAGVSKSEFIHDGLSRRRIIREYSWSGSAWQQTNETHLVYDGMQIIQERDSNNNPQVTYTRGLDLSGSRSGAGGIGGLLARTDLNGSAFYHADGAGNVTALMDPAENIVGRYLYGPFGNPIGRWGSLAAANAMQSSSMPGHRPSGLILYPYRAYEPNFQRWISADRIGERGGLNLHRFVYNNPLEFVDTDGLAPQLVSVSFDLNGGNASATYAYDKFGSDIRAAHAPLNESSLEYAEAAFAQAAQATYDPNSSGLDTAGFYLRGVGFTILGVLEVIPDGGLLSQPCKVAAKKAAGKAARKAARTVADDSAKWIWGQNKGVAKSIRQMDQRGWSPQQVTEAIKGGQQFPAQNLVNPGNPAVRFVSPQTGQSVVQDTVTKEIIHFGGPGFKY